MISSIDPRTGSTVESIPAPGVEDVDALAAAAQSAFAELATAERPGRATMLRAMADALESDRAALVAIADRETALGYQRLNGELTRAQFQLRFFADVIDDGGYLEATIDHARPTAMGPRPDLRRILVPLGPVAVFGASNFPFAFSVPGGDTASALAAGCPVIVKVHPAHPATSVRCREVLLAGARSTGIAADVVALVYGNDAAAQVVRHPAITAVGFTGSLQVGRMLADVAAARPAPIPFYGELGAVNPLVVARTAARARGRQIAEGLAGSFTLGMGQFCTKPGVALVPSGADGDELRRELVARVAEMGAGTMLSARTADAFAAGTERLVNQPGVQVMVRGGDRPADGFWGTPLVLRAEAKAVAGPLLDECFGPVLVLVEYDDGDEALDVLSRFGPALTTSIHADEADMAFAAGLLAHAQARSGRVVWNGFPTGVAVAWAMQHGGPYPAATNALHTSVGATAIRRWLRPVSFQDVPMDLLPDELRDEPRHARVPRRIDGTLIPA